MSTIIRNEILPNPRKLYDLVIPQLGHSPNDAFFDLIDNSIDADASEIRVQIFSGENGKIIKYRVIDNGCGMDYEQLVKSFQLANESLHEIGSMGKYGVGGTIASFTLGKSKKVLTKAKNGQLYIAKQDIEDKDFQLHVLEVPEEDSKLFEELCGENGTIIEIDSLREQKYTVAGHFKNMLVPGIGETFRHYLDKKKIFVDLIDLKEQMTTSDVYPTDPLFWNTDKCEKKQEKIYTIDNMEFTLRYVVLDPTKFDTKLKQEDQGFYFVRNNRQIIGGTAVKGVWTSHPQANYIRVEFRFHEDLDEKIGLTATKNKIFLSDDIKGKIVADITTWKNSYRTSNVNKTNPSSLKEEQQELDKLRDKLQKNGAAIGAQKSKKETENGSRAPKQNNTGAVEKKNTSITRKPPQQPTRVIPEFKIEPFPHNDDSVSYVCEDNKTIVFINENSSFNKENYFEAKEEQKKMLKILWAANALALYERYDKEEREFEICKKYTDFVSRNMVEIYKFVS